MSPTKTEYKHIYFTSEPARVWACRNNKSKNVLAILAMYHPWRRYCVTEVSGIAVFDAGCLRDIAHFLDQLNKGD